MTIATLPTRAASLNHVSFSGRVDPAEFNDLMAFYADNGAVAARRDKLLVVRSDADLSALTHEVLTSIATRLCAAVSQAQMPIIVRTAIVSLAPAQRAVVEAWRTMVAGEPGLLTEVAAFESLHAATAWIGLTAEETDDVVLRQAEQTAALVASSVANAR